MLTARLLEVPGTQPRRAEHHDRARQRPLPRVAEPAARLAGQHQPPLQLQIANEAVLRRQPLRDVRLGPRVQVVRAPPVVAPAQDERLFSRALQVVQHGVLELARDVFAGLQTQDDVTTACRPRRSGHYSGRAAHVHALPMRRLRSRRWTVPRLIAATLAAPSKARMRRGVRAAAAAGGLLPASAADSATSARSIQRIRPV